MARTQQRIGFLFPGQGAQTLGMGKEFFANIAASRQVIEEAEDLLQLPLRKWINEGPETLLKQTDVSQIAIYVTSYAIVQGVHQELGLSPCVCAGLSLGEYTAITAAKWVSYTALLPIVKMRGDLMRLECQKKPGTMAAVIGFARGAVEATLRTSPFSDEVWIANYNSPEQIVISGTMRAVEAAAQCLKDAGVKRVIPLQVDGAFHSGLMKGAQTQLTPHLQSLPLHLGATKVTSNFSGGFLSSVEELRHALSHQITHPVRWEEQIRSMAPYVDAFIEFGPGKTLSGMVKRIDASITVDSIDSWIDFNRIAEKLP